MVQDHNSKEDKLYTMEVNHLADLTREEMNFDDINLQDLSTFDNLDIHTLQQTPSVVKDEFDWRNETNRLSPVYNQGLVCKAGWAFHAASALETAIALSDKKPVQTTAVSIQYLIDCDIKNRGCSGGLATRSFQYVGTNGYLHLNTY